MGMPMRAGIVYGIGWIKTFTTFLKGFEWRLVVGLIGLTMERKTIDCNIDFFMVYEKQIFVTTILSCIYLCILLIEFKLMNVRYEKSFKIHNLLWFLKNGIQ